MNAGNTSLANSSDEILNDPVRINTIPVAMRTSAKVFRKRACEYAIAASPGEKVTKGLYRSAVVLMMHHLQVNSTANLPQVEKLQHFAVNNQRGNHQIAKPHLPGE